MIEPALASLTRRFIIAPIAYEVKALAMSYIRVEERLRRVQAPSVGRAFIAAQLVLLALIVLNGNAIQAPVHVATLTAGALITGAGIWRHRRSRLTGRMLIVFGGYSLVVAVGWVEPLLGVLSLIVYSIAAVIAFSA